jgi:hypothetical protein
MLAPVFVLYSLGDGCGAGLGRSGLQPAAGELKQKRIVVEEPFV